MSDLFKAITALPSDVTLISLPAGPLLELVCMAAQRQLTAVWLSLASMLILQLNPPSLVPTTFKSEPSAEASEIALNVLTVLLQTSLSAFSQPGVMVSNPDVVQAFFGLMESVSELEASVFMIVLISVRQFVHHFLPMFYRLPEDLFNTLIQCAIGALSLQERYSLTSSCAFLVGLVHSSSSRSED